MFQLQEVRHVFILLLQQEVETRCGEALCRLFPQDEHIDVVEILRDARRRRREMATKRNREPLRLGLQPNGLKLGQSITRPTPLRGLCGPLLDPHLMDIPLYGLLYQTLKSWPGGPHSPHPG